MDNLNRQTIEMSGTRYIRTHTYRSTVGIAYNGSMRATRVVQKVHK